MIKCKHKKLLAKNHRRAKKYTIFRSFLDFWPSKIGLWVYICIPSCAAYKLIKLHYVPYFGDMAPRLSHPNPQKTSKIGLFLGKKSFFGNLTEQTQSNNFGTSLNRFSGQKYVRKHVDYTSRASSRKKPLTAWTRWTAFLSLVDVLSARELVKIFFIISRVLTCRLVVLNV